MMFNNVRKLYIQINPFTVNWTFEHLLSLNKSLVNIIELFIRERQHVEGTIPTAVARKKLASMLTTDMTPSAICLWHQTF